MSSEPTPEVTRAIRTDDGVVGEAGGASQARPGSRDRPFSEVHMRGFRRDDLLRGLAGPMWKFALAGLYLETGRCIPEAAKRRGCFFGFCDSEGVMCPASSGTHIGWHVDDELVEDKGASG